jgi:hypothetical protein
MVMGSKAAELGAAVAAVFGNDDWIAHSSSMALQAAAGEVTRDGFLSSLDPILAAGPLRHELGAIHHSPGARRRPVSLDQAMFVHLDPQMHSVAFLQALERRWRSRTWRGRRSSIVHSN